MIKPFTRSRFNRATIIATLALLASPTAAFAARNPITDSPSVQVTGVGKAMATADMARASLSVESTAPTATAATAANAGAAQRVTDALTSAGVAAKDVQTAGLSLYPQTSQSPDPNTITGYQAVLGLNVVLRDLTRAGAVLDAAVAAGANAVRINRVSFELSDNNPLLAAARKAAVADARKKADHYAVLTDLALGTVLRITEQSSSGPVLPPGLPVAAGSPTSATTPIQPGDIEVVVTVEVVWALRSTVPTRAS